MNKTIYMTYKKEVPDIVFKRWKDLNTDYNIEFSLDDDCIKFLKTHFNEYIAQLFIDIPVGMFKADLWRLCKLYIHGGVYADVDLVPYINIDTLDKDVTFYSCITITDNAIFQAFMINFSKPKNPLLLHFLLSFLMNNPYYTANGPTFDMYKCIQYNLNGIHLLPETTYELTEIKIPIRVGFSETNSKLIDLHYFPDDIEYSIKLISTGYKDTFDFSIKDNILTITRTDEVTGWGYPHSIVIVIPSREKIFLFKENCEENWVQSFVTHNHTKILDSRDLDYYHNNGW